MTTTHKRGFQEVLGDENDPIPPPRARPRLASAASGSVKAPLHAKSTHTKRGQASRPLKSALKRSASESETQVISETKPSNSVTPLTRATTHPSVANHSRNSTLSTKQTILSRIKLASWMPVVSPDLGRAALSLDISEASSTSPKGPPPPTTTTSRPKRTVRFDDAGSPPLKRRHTTPDPLGGQDVLTPNASKCNRDDDAEDDAGLMTPVPGTPIAPRKPVASRSPDSLPNRHVSRKERSKVCSEKGKRKKNGLESDFGSVVTESAPPLPSMTTPFTLPPPRTIVDYVGEERLKEYAREKNNAMEAAGLTKIMPGSRGVLRRITVDIVPHQRHCTVWDANEQYVQLVHPLGVLLTVTLLQRYVRLGRHPRPARRQTCILFLPTSLHPEHPD